MQNQSCGLESQLQALLIPNHHTRAIITHGLYFLNPILINNLLCKLFSMKILLLYSWLVLNNGFSSIYILLNLQYSYQQLQACYPQKHGWKTGIIQFISILRLQKKLCYSSQSLQFYLFLVIHTYYSVRVIPARLSYNRYKMPTKSFCVFKEVQNFGFGRRVDM